MVRAGVIFMCFICALLFSCKKGNTGLQNNTFIKVYPSKEGHTEINSGLLAAADGSVYLYGFDHSDTDANILMKIDGGGKLIWKKELQGYTINGYPFNPSQVVLTNDNQVLISSAILLTRLDASGNITLQTNSPISVYPCSNGNYVGFGTGSSSLTGIYYCWSYLFGNDFTYIKSDSFVITGNNQILGAVHDQEGNFYAAGEVFSNYGGPFGPSFLFKISPDLKLQWSKTGVGDTIGRHTAVDLCLDKNQNVYIIGTTGSILIGDYVNFHTNPNLTFQEDLGSIFIRKYDSSGKLLANKLFTEIPGNFMVSKIVSVSDGLVITGTSNISNNISDATAYGQLFLIKVNTNLDVLWQQYYKTTYTAQGSGLCQAADGGYYISATIKSLDKQYDMALLKTDANGNLK